jgi:hypothetical protein
MRAVVFDVVGSPLRVANVPSPECPRAGVVIDVKATGICRSDWHAGRGHEVVPLPHVPRHEFSGVVTETGAEVSAFSVGIGHGAVRERVWAMRLVSDWAGSGLPSSDPVATTMPAWAGTGRSIAIKTSPACSKVGARRAAVVKAVRAEQREGSRSSPRCSSHEVGGGRRSRGDRRQAGGLWHEW